MFQPRTDADTSQQITTPTRLLHGIVTSAKAIKTLTVIISYQVRHPKYGKYIKRHTKLQVHDELQLGHEGDIVEVVASRPFSKTKRHRLVRVVAIGTGKALQVADKDLPWSQPRAVELSTDAAALRDHTGSSTSSRERLRRTGQQCAMQWYEHAGTTWLLRERPPVAAVSQPSGLSFRRPSDLRLAVYPPEASEGAPALFFLDTRQEMPGAPRYLALTWAHAAEPQTLWKWGIKLLRTVGRFTGGATSVLGPRRDASVTWRYVRYVDDAPELLRGHAVDPDAADANARDQLVASAGIDAMACKWGRLEFIVDPPIDGEAQVTFVWPLLATGEWTTQLAEAIRSTSVRPAGLPLPASADLAETVREAVGAAT